MIRGSLVIVNLDLTSTTAHGLADSTSSFSWAFKLSPLQTRSFSAIAISYWFFDSTDSLLADFVLSKLNHF